MPSVQTPLLLRQSAGSGPWATVQVSAAVPLTQPLFAGYRVSKKVEPVSQRVKGQYSRGDVLKVTVLVEATAERNWVVVNDPIPAGATLVSDLGGQSQMLAGQEQAGGGSRFSVTDKDGKVWDVQAGVSPAYVERRRDSWRGYFDWVPRGNFAIVYLMRLNGAGTFSMPSTRVEAMYSPSINAQLPNASMTIAQK